MGSKSRKRKQAARAVERVMAEMAVSDTPIHVAYTAMSRARFDATKPRSPKTKASHVLAKESSAHQYIGGDRARPPMLTPQERKHNKDARKPAPQRTRIERRVLDSNGDMVPAKARTVAREPKPRISRGGHYVSDPSGAALVAGVTLQDKDLAKVTVSKGKRRVLSPQQRRERAADGM